MHYLVQVSLATLEAAALAPLSDKGGGRYVGFFPSGQAVIAGPIIDDLGLPWFEVQATAVAVLAELGASKSGLMRDEVRKLGHLENAYRDSISSRSNERRAIKNKRGDTVGVTPNFVFCGTDPEGSFTAGEDREQAPKIPGLDSIGR